MAFEQVKVWDVVDRAVGHKWSIPEFQRGFVWKATQVRDLAESMWQSFPIGSLLVWNARAQVEEQIAIDAQKPSLWLVDGQQRTTALCVLFGRKPYWWNSSEDWNNLLRRYDIRFDVDAKEPPFFYVANAATRRAKGNRFIPLSKLLTLDLTKEGDQRSLTEMAKQVKEEDLCHGMDSMEVYTKLDRIRKIRDLDLVTVTVDHELEDVVEIFSRLNSKGTRVTEADIYLGVVAARTPGWVRDQFLPFRGRLADGGFDIGPNLLFRSLTAVGIGKTRFRDIPDEFWNADAILPAWDKAKMAWQSLVNRFRDYGILSNDPMPTETALVTMVALVNKFPTAPFGQMLSWFLTASRFNRYSGSATTSLEEDLRAVGDASSCEVALEVLSSHFAIYPKGHTVDDFMRDYGDTRYGRFLLYLLIYERKARDWDEAGHRIGFEGSDLLSGFRPQWHHIFPVKYLEGKADDAQINALANIAVIGPTINIRISAQDPLGYVSKYKIGPEKLQQQMIDPDFIEVEPSNFPTWLQQRASSLAAQADALYKNLQHGS